MITREFQFHEGSSDKFWRITLDGKSNTVRFGRRGTDGQTQTKEFSSEDDATKNCDKLIAEKLKKGYVEVTTEGTVGDAKVTPKPAITRPTTAAAVGNEPGEPQPKAVMVPPALPVAVAASQIELTDEDWRIATWRKVSPPPATAPAPFDRDACAAKLRKLRFRGYGWEPVWSAVELPSVMTREEAHYWFEAMTSLSKDADMDALAEKLAQAETDGRVSPAHVRSAYETTAVHGSPGRFITEHLVLALKHLLSTADLVDLMLDDTMHGQQYRYNKAFLEGFRLYVLPGLSQTDVEDVRARLRSRVQPANWSQDKYHVPAPFLVAASLGMHDELLPIVEGWPDDCYVKEGWTDHYHQPQRIIFGLRDPGLVEAQVRRLKLQLKTPLLIRGWLAHTETRALDVVRDSILAVANKDEAEDLVRTFGLVRAPKAAGPMLELHLKSKAPKAAREWLDGNTAHAVVGLVEVAGTRGALADAAIEQLRSWKKRGWAEPIAAAVEGLEPSFRERLRQEVVAREEVVLAPFDADDTPVWLSKASAAVAVKKAPQWVAPSDLPPIVLGGRRLSDEQILRVFTALQATALDGQHELLAGLRANADAASADAFAWKLFERWLAEGAPTKDKWAFAVVGFLGGDASVLRLTPMVRAWPGESQHARAVLGLEVLRRIGSDTALMQLNGIAQKLKFQGLKVKARTLMEEIALEKGLTRAELEDRVVPDCDLDERGQRTFDFGPRQFQFVLGADMKPMVRDGAGKLRDNLPEPGAKDDPSQAQAAVDEWKLMKKQIREVVKIQADRLEQAMVTGRRWKAEDFATLIARQPLMTHLARRLLWGTYDGSALGASFRISEDQQYTSIADQEFVLPAGASVGVVHPLQMDDRARNTWSQLFADYEIIPPFPQLGRAIHRLEPSEEKRSALERFNGRKLPAPTLVFTLEKLGWVRGTAMDAGCFDEHSRQFPAANVTALLTYEGTVGMGYIDPNEQLTLTGCCFVEGLREPSGYEKPNGGIELGRVDPVVISETLHDLTALADKAS